MFQRDYLPNVTWVLNRQTTLRGSQSNKVQNRYLRFKQTAPLIFHKWRFHSSSIKKLFFSLLYSIIAGTNKLQYEDPHFRYSCNERNWARKVRSPQLSCPCCHSRYRVQLSPLSPTRSLPPPKTPPRTHTSYTTHHTPLTTHRPHG